MKRYKIECISPEISSLLTLEEIKNIVKTALWIPVEDITVTEITGVIDPLENTDIQQIIPSFAALTPEEKESLLPMPKEETELPESDLPEPDPENQVVEEGEVEELEDEVDDNDIEIDEVGEADDDDEDAEIESEIEDEDKALRSNSDD